jgi:hypothetical protein
LTKTIQHPPADRGRKAALYTGAILAVSQALFGQQAVWTAHYDNFRTGANTSETILSPANLNPRQFGRLGALPVGGCVVAQPLYVPYVPIEGRGMRNLVLVATTTNMVYAFDADNYSLYYNVGFGTPYPSTLILSGGYHDFPDCDAGDGDGPIGIVGTPVIDTAEQAMYFVANTADGDPGAPTSHHILHKISLSTGQDLLPPVEIAGSFQGVNFQSRFQLQRAALMLLNGRIYVTFGSHQDEVPYYGWMFAYDPNLTQLGVMNFSPTRSGAGIWQSGGGPASGGRLIYFNTGNNAEGDADQSENSESILQVDPISLEVIAKTSFAEGDEWDWGFDLDLGSSRVIVMPENNRLVGGSKLGDIFSVNRTGMMLESRRQAAARQSAGVDWTGIYNGLAYWNRTIYVWPGGGGFIYGPLPPFPTDTLKAFTLNSDYQLVKVADGDSAGTALGYQGANLVVSANGDDPASGIVWAMTPMLNTGGLQPGFLHAYSAADFSDGMFHELWSDTPLGDASDMGYNFAKFTQPLIANGKVYLPTFSGKVIVYGLLPNPAAPGESARPAAARSVNKR